MLIKLGVEADINSFRTSAVGFSPKISAEIPATWGDAIEVPEIVLVVVGEPIHAAVMRSPGAMISTQLPQFEKYARSSRFTPFLLATVVAPTVIALGSEAGEVCEN